MIFFMKMAMPRRSKGDLGASMELHAFLRSSAFLQSFIWQLLSRRFYCVHRVFTARALRVHRAFKAIHSDYVILYLLDLAPLAVDNQSW